MYLKTSFAFLALGLIGLSLLPQTAQASGFFLTERGTRSLGRGGAFVAGAEEVESLWINPAGLAGAGSSFRMEGNLNVMRGSFTRLDDEGVTHPKVDMKAAYLPIPMFGATRDHGLRDWDFGYAFYLPSASVYEWPDNVDGDPAPQRYSLYSLRGSIFGNLAAGAAYSGIKGLSIGLSAALITGRFKASMALSACEGFICVHPEDPGFDATAVITLRRFAALMIGAGIIYKAGPVKFGASMQSPWTMQGKSRFDIDLPSDPAFANATIDGDSGRVEVPFAMIGRGGIELTLFRDLRIETALVWEQWSRQKEITADASGVFIRDIVGIGDYQVGEVTIHRGMKDAYSFRGGMEYDFSGITARMGVSYDTSAFSSQTLSPLTLDADKIVASIGVTLHSEDVFDLDLVYSHVFAPDQRVRDSVITQPSAIRPPQSVAEQSVIANGDYTIKADIIGIGSTFRF